MVAVSAVIFVVMPVAGSIETTDGTLLLHVPPLVVSVKTPGVPTQFAAGPVIFGGNGFMVTVTLPSVPQQPDADWALK